MQFRLLQPILNGALDERPVVLIQGPRQAGKSTLAQSVGDARGLRYYTFDDATVLGAALADPAGFIGGLAGPVVLDEAQRAPDLLLAIKHSVDRRRTPGRFLLTGSANVLALPKVSDSLAGRMELLTLWPLAQAEIEGGKGTFVASLFGNPSHAPVPDRQSASLNERILRGGFPEVALGAITRRDAWFGSYLTTILQRDVRDLANVEDLAAFPRLLALLAAQPAGLLNYSRLSRDSGLAMSTLKRYFALLETTFLVQTIPPWYARRTSRLVKTPKVMLTDSGLAAHLLGLDAARLEGEPVLRGGLVESLVAMELRKQLGWSGLRVTMCHFRSHTGAEVDLVLEAPGGDLVGIEVKAAASVSDTDFKGLRALADLARKQFRRGVVLYTGTESVPFGPGLEARPIQSLWT